MWKTQTAIDFPPLVVRACAIVARGLALASPAHAIVVLPKGSGRPVMGYLVRQDDKTVVVREIQPDGKPREQMFRRDEIDELLVTVSPERLAELDPARPQLYREYAEELAEKQRDPEARDMAVRLYHMAAVLGEGSLRRSALLGLAALARSPAEERRLRAAAYLYDAEHDPALLGGLDEIKLSAPGDAKELLAELLAALRQCRQGRGSQARAILEKPAVRQQAEGLAKIVTIDELLAACAAKELSDEQLERLLRAEMAVEGSIGERAAATSAELARAPTSWAAAARSKGLGALPSLALESLTEFDPRACVYRDGKWGRP